MCVSGYCCCFFFSLSTMWWILIKYIGKLMFAQYCCFLAIYIFNRSFFTNGKSRLLCLNILNAQHFKTNEFSVELNFLYFRILCQLPHGFSQFLLKFGVQNTNIHTHCGAFTFESGKKTSGSMCVFVFWKDAFDTQLEIASV